MDYDKLIEQLKNAAGGPEGIKMCQDAALAIETLRAESIMHHNAVDNYFAEANEYREERNDALTELEQMAACIYYKPGGLCRYDGDDPANMCVLGPCPNNKSAEKVLADLARVTAERDAAIKAVKNMAEYIVCAGRVDYYLCDEISKEHHLKYQPKNDGNYDNEPCYKCIADWFLQGHEWQENCW